MLVVCRLLHVLRDHDAGFNLIEALRVVAQAGRLPARCSDQGHRFRRRIDHRVHAVNDPPSDRLPEDAELDRRAPRSGFPDGAVLQEHVERCTSRCVVHTFVS
ncbi:MAG: hypothetical protein H0T79_02520 [Deltaproteobacteria bacterium]|nr:hypothetical protein [Deltaproteobacteria bacterium]